MLNKKFLFFTVFASGMTTLAVEISASRLLGNIFGTSNMVWASIIGLILIYLTAGYFLGGIWADKSPYPRVMYSILAWGAFLTGLVPSVAKPVLRLAADAFDELQLGILLGSFVGVLVLFSIPVTLLGTISPFAIRLAINNPGEAGSVSGRIYAISTMGSFIGTFLPVLIMIPTIGTTRTFLVFSLVLNIIAILGIWISLGSRFVLRWVWMPIVLIFLLVVGGGRAIKASEGQIYEAESAYNYIQVLENEGYRYLRLNEGMGVHSVYHPTELVYYGPWMQFLSAPFFNDPPYKIENIKSLAIVGLAGGTLARQASAVFGPIPIDGFEIDPKIIDVGQQYFGMNLENLQAVAQDGRWGLEHSSGKYSLIAIDAYRPPYIPWHLTTREFFQIARDHMVDDGVLVINVGRATNDRRLIEGLVGTLQTIFPSLFTMDVPGTFNTIVYATVQPTTVNNLYLNTLELQRNVETHPLLLEALQLTAVYLQPTPQVNVVYTDDKAPIEWITNQLMLNFVFSGDIQDLQ